MNKSMETDMSDIGNEVFDAICTVMDLLRRGRIDRSTPNSKVYSMYKRQKEIDNIAVKQ